MKKRLFSVISFSILLFSFSAIAQSRISRVTPYEFNIENRLNRQTQTKIIQAEINELEMASIQIGKTALPVIYQFGSQKLSLNGVGLREMLWLDLYACGLYLTKNNSSAPFIVGADKPMVLRLDILSNKIDKTKLIKAFQQGFEKSNTEQVIKKFKFELTEFINFVDDEIKIGDKYDIVYTPEVGTSLYINYKIKGTIKGLAFKAAIYNIWLSDNPADKSLKKDLISNPASLVIK